MDLQTLAKKLQPLMAIFVLAMLILLSVKLIENNKLQKEISENCGWNTEKYRCFCEYSKVINFEQSNINLNNILSDNVPLAG